MLKNRMYCTWCTTTFNPFNCHVTQHCLICVIGWCGLVAQKITDTGQSNLRLHPRVRETCRQQRHTDRMKAIPFLNTERAQMSCRSFFFWGGKCFSSPSLWDISCVVTVCFYDDDVLGLVKVVLGAVSLEVADHLIDTSQGSVEVGARLFSMACRRTNAKRWNGGNVIWQMI